jgi:hypothetical protein
MQLRSCLNQRQVWIDVDARGRKKRRGSDTGEHQLAPPSLRASRSLLRNMKEALKGTTLHYRISATGSTQHPGFHHSQRVSGWGFRSSNLFNSKWIILERRQFKDEYSLCQALFILILSNLNFRAMAIHICHYGRSANYPYFFKSQRFISLLIPIQSPRWLYIGVSMGSILAALLICKFPVLNRRLSI